MATTTETLRRHVYGIGLVCRICGKPYCDHPAEIPVRSDHHLCFAAQWGELFEVLKSAKSDYFIALTSSPVMSDGDRCGRYFTHRSWSGDRVRDTLHNLGYEIL
jgi:hypothetical protein